MTPGPDTSNYKRMHIEKLIQKTDKLLANARGRLEKVIAGNCLEEQKSKIAAIRGSLYYLSLLGNEEDGYISPPLFN